MDHANRKHAYLSASGSSRWINCTPSPRMEEQFPDETSDYAKEGTLAHEFADAFLRLQTGQITKQQYSRIRKKLEKSEFYGPAMDRYVENYTDYCLERLSELPDGLMFIENRLDFSKYVPHGFGTGDTMIVGGGKLIFIDLKYGKGVKVSAKSNSQLRLYALGGLEFFELTHEIDEIEMVIMQPRLDHVSSQKISTADLITWAEQEVVPAAQKAINGEGELRAGAWCQFCRAKSTCRAFYEKAVEAAKFDFADPETLTLEECVEAMRSAGMLSSWLKGVSSYLMNLALSGKPIPGLKLVEGRSRRTWKDEEAAIEKLQAMGFVPSDITNTKIRGIGDISDLMPVDRFEKELNHLIDKPPGSPKLVPEDDPRPEYSAVANAASDFS